MHIHLCMYVFNDTKKIICSVIHVISLTKKKIVLQNIENIYINNWYTYLKRTFNLQILQITMNYWLWKCCSNVCMYIHKYVWIPMCMYIHRYVLYMFIFLLIFCFLSVCIFIRVRIICSRKSKFVVKYAL